MQRHLLILFSFFLFLSGYGQVVITTDYENLNHSIADQLIIYEDSTHLAEIEDLLNGYYNYQGRQLDHSVENLNFTTSSWHCNFILDNTNGPDLFLYLEVARPITNEVNLYEYHNSGEAVSTSRSGDGIPFTSKAYYHQKSIIPIQIKKGEIKNYWLELKSDGEIISLPFILWDKREFEIRNQKEQLYLGIFYGIFVFVFLIYLFFFIILKDKSFLFYIFYVASSALLQFSLDGFVHEFIFRSGGYASQHFVIFIASTSVLFVVLYAKIFLKLKERNKKLNRVFSISLLLSSFVILLSLIPGAPYEAAYYLVNVFSLIAVILILVAIVILKRKKHRIDPFFALGFIFLITSAIIFILGNFSIINLPGLTQNALKYGTLIEILFLSISMANKYRELQREKEAAQALVLKQLEEQNEFIENQNVLLESQVIERTKEIEEQKEELKEKNDDILASIQYAERIQKAVLPSMKKFKALLPNSFVLFKPRDIVSGDFFWIEEIISSDKSKKLIVYATGDCTGHGVPGALVHIVGQNFLRLGKFTEGVNSPAEALDFLNQGIKETFSSKYKDETIRDGMDIALCAIDFETNMLTFSGAKNPVWIIRNNEILEFKGDKKPIGSYDDVDVSLFTNQEIELQKDDVIYTFSDGYPDQFGGPKGKKFMYGKFKKLLLEIHKKKLDDQHNILDQRYTEWRGKHEQIDDVIVIGVRI